MAITTLIAFKQYCLRSLGAPILTIDVTDDQLADRYDDALRKYQDYHFDGTEKTFLKHTVTQTDFDNKYISLPTNVVSIIRILPYNSGYASSDQLFSAQYQFLQNEMHNLWSGGDLAYYKMTMTNLALLQETLSGKPTYRFNKVTDKLYIDISWERKLNVGSTVVVECMLSINPETNDKVFNDVWFKRYYTALVKRQWGTNLKKFSNVVMMGGTTLNGQIIFDEANQEVMELEQELEDKWSEPIDCIFIG